MISVGAVTDLVPAERITPLLRPQSIAVPAITLQRTAMVPQQQLRGQANLDLNSVQLDVWAVGYIEATAIAAACRSALQASECRLTFEGDNYEPDVDPAIFRITQNWSVWTN